MRKCSSDYLILALKCDLHSLSIIGDLLFKIFGTEQTTSPSLEPRPDSRSTLQGKLQIIFWVLGRKADQRSGRILRTFPCTRCAEAPPLPPWKEGTAQLHTPPHSQLGGLGKSSDFFFATHLLADQRKIKCLARLRSDNTCGRKVKGRLNKCCVNWEQRPPVLLTHHL